MCRDFSEEEAPFEIDVGGADSKAAFAQWAWHRRRRSHPAATLQDFVGWNLLAEDMLQCEVDKQHGMMLEISAQG